MTEPLPPYFAQTLPQTKIVQLYTPVTGKGVRAYDADRQYFSPKRSFALRESGYGEFEPLQLYTSPGRMGWLWVLVMRLASGFHIAAPVWRGTPPFKTVTLNHLRYADVGSDAEIFSIIEECVAQGGQCAVSYAEWQASQNAVPL